MSDRKRSAPQAPDASPDPDDVPDEHGWHPARIVLDPEEEQKLARAALDILLSDAAKGRAVVPEMADPPAQPLPAPAAVPWEKKARARWLTDWVITRWKEQPSERPNLSRETLRKAWREQLRARGVKWHEIEAVYAGRPEVHGERSKPNRPA